MNMYLVWPVWLLSIIGATAVSFGVLEAYAIRHDVPTLSRFIWEASVNYLVWVIIFVGVAGFIAGFLTCHFWWGGIVSFAPVKKMLGG